MNMVNAKGLFLLYKNDLSSSQGFLEWKKKINYYLLFGHIIQLLIDSW